MYHNTSTIRLIARIILAFFITNTITPSLQFAFADSTQYYVDATGGNDTNDGLSPATAWQTLSKVSSTPLLQGDTVSLLCSESWAESLTLTTLPGSPGLPVTINAYGSCPTETPTIEGVNIVSSSYVVFDGIDITSALPGSTVSIDVSNNITLQNSTISGINATCATVVASSGVLIDGNTVSSCQNAMSISGSESIVSNNTFSTILTNGVEVLSDLPVDVSYNTFSNVGESAVMFGRDTNVLRNSITTVCTTGSTECGAIRSNPNISGATTSTVTENSIKDVGTGVNSSGNAGILTSGVSTVSIVSNGVINAQYAVRLIDTSDSAISLNTLISSRINSLSVIQNNVGTTFGNSFTGNTFEQRAPDYPYIELRDEVPGNGVVSGFMTFDANSIIPNYKPNTSYLRTVKFGGETEEFEKADLTLIDPNMSKFEFFGYKPYVNTGSYATANQLTNGDFTSDASNWTPSALTGSAPSISHNPTGSHIGGSATITPAGGSADRIWITNDAILSVTSGQVFHVTGYAKSSSGNINLRAFLHSSGDKTTLYSDKIAETYATSTGRTFSFYLTVTTTAADAQLTFETSNNDVAYEVDELSFRRLAAHVKNTNTFEVLAYENPTGVTATQSCPSGALCTAYVDGANTTINWPISIPAYSTAYVLWNGGPNILYPPTCAINLAAGSVPTGQPADITWFATGSFSHTLNYATEASGAISESVAESGALSFIPPYNANTTISLAIENDVGPSSCQVDVTTNNTPPELFPITITGSEDDSQIDATLSGIDLNPGDIIFFYKLSDPVHGVINVDSSGSMQYYPYPDFCGVDSFDFTADDDKYNTSPDIISQNITLACSNDIPSAVNDDAATNGPMIQIDVLANDTDPDNIYEAQTFSVVSFSQPLSGSVIQNGQLLEYTPTGSFSGSDVFVYRMQDQSGALSTNTGTVTVHVTLPNMAPTTNNMNFTINEDTVISDTLSGSDINGDVLSFTALTLPANGVLNLLTNGTFTYTPALEYSGTDTFDFIANDGAFDSNTGTVNITINNVLDPPVGVNDSYSLNQDTYISAPVMSNDSDSDSLTLILTGITNPSNGTVVLSGTSIDYIPNSGYAGPDSFTYQVEDDTGLLSNVVTVTINVIFTNAPPVAYSTSVSVNEDVTLVGTASGSDPELSTLSYFLDASTLNGSLTFTSTGGYRYIPNANYNGSDSFSFHVSDGVLTSTAATIDITVNSINDTPTANATTVTAVGNSVVSGGHTFTGILSANDIDGNPLSFTTATLPVHGFLTMTSTGYITYTPAVGYIGSDSFTFRVNDGTVNSANATVNINVTTNGVPIPLGYFSVVAPSSVYSGAVFSVVIQARDLVGNILTNYTGSIAFTSTDPLAVLPASISFAPGDAGVKTLTNATIFNTLGNISLRVQDTLSTESGSAIIYVALPVTSIPSGPGGIAAGGASTTGGAYNYGSAPGMEPISYFQFVGVGAELMDKLMLVNRIVGSGGILMSSSTGSGSPILSSNGGSPIISSNGGGQTFLLNLTEDELSDDFSTLTLRAAFWDHYNRAILSQDPEGMFDTAREKLDSFDFDMNDRLQLVRDVLLRILDSQKRKYREIIDRDVTSLSSSSTDEILDSQDNPETSDLSEADLSELELTDEELALLFG